MSEDSRADSAWLRVDSWCATTVDETPITISSGRNRMTTNDALMLSGNSLLPGWRGTSASELEPEVSVKRCR